LELLLKACFCHSKQPLAVFESASYWGGYQSPYKIYTLNLKKQDPKKAIPFGKHKGMLLADVPSDYRQWLLTQGDINPYLRKALGV